MGQKTMLATDPNNLWGTELPLLGSNQDSPDPESGSDPAAPTTYKVAGGQNIPEAGPNETHCPPDNPPDTFGHRSNGRGTLVIDRIYGQVGRIRRASGTTDRALFAELMAMLDGLFERRDYTALSAIRDGAAAPIEALGTHRMATAPRPERRRASVVYFIQATPSGNIKIGLTADPEARLIGLQTGTHESLTLLATARGDRLTEMGLHRQFAEDHIAREWFRPSVALRAHIDAILSPDKCNGAACCYGNRHCHKCCDLGFPF